MPTRDRRIDAYIAGAAPFARPVLTHLRRVVHKGCPQVEEAIRWGMPAFLYRGKILCGMAAFKAHCAFHFWQGSRVITAGRAKTGEAMGQFGRIASVKDLPGRTVLVRDVRRAMKLRDAVATTPTRRRPARREAVVPADLAAGFRKSAKARAAWGRFSPSARRDYVEWITEAKRPATRAARLRTTLQWIAEGKMRNWKYG